MSKISVDEYLSQRSISVNSAGAVLKQFREPASFNRDERTARFVMSSESIDRMGDVVVQAGLDVSGFEKNPQALLFHNSRAFPIGLWENISKVNGRPKRTEGTLRFMPEGEDDDADRTARHVAFGTLRAVSIGFIPKDVEVRRDDDEHFAGFRITESEMIECSVVPVPANPDAIVKAADGDFRMAYDLIEEVLDTYTKNDAGLIVPRETYEDVRKEIVRADSPAKEPQDDTTQTISLTLDVDTGDFEHKMSRVSRMSEQIKDALEGIFGQKAEHHEFGVEHWLTKHPDSKLINLKLVCEGGVDTVHVADDAWPVEAVFDKDSIKDSTETNRVDDNVLIKVENGSATYEIIYETPTEVVGKLVEGTIDVPEPETVSGSRSQARSRLLNLKAEAASLGL